MFQAAGAEASGSLSEHSIWKMKSAAPIRGCIRVGWRDEGRSYLQNINIEQMESKTEGATQGGTFV